MNILVLGAGAIGSAFGGFLAKSGNRVVLYGREQCISAINERGLLIEGIWGNHHITTIKGYSSLPKIARREGSLFDLILVTVKSYDTAHVMHQYLTAFGTTGLAVSLQNGLGNLETIAGLLGKDRTIGGRVLFGAELREPGVVRITVYADKVVLGPLQGGVCIETVKEICFLFERAGIPTVWTEAIDKYIWGKALYNTALNALSCLLDVTYGALLENDQARKIMEDIVTELFTVIHRKNIVVDWDDAGAYISHLFAELIPATREHCSSMLQDIRRGKKTEIDALNGKVVAMAEEMGLDVPVNRILTALVKAKQR